MKIIKILPAFLLMCFCHQYATAGNPEWLTELQAPHVGLNNLNIAPPPPAVALRNPDFCQQYKRQEITGWVLFGVGAGSIAGGSYLVYKGVTHALNNSTTYNVEGTAVTGPAISKRDVTFIAAGSALGLVGLILTPTGLAEGIIGTVRYNKYCGRTSYLIAPTMDSNGVGIAANF